MADTRIPSFLKDKEEEAAVTAPPVVQAPESPVQSAVPTRLPSFAREPEATVAPLPDALRTPSFVKEAPKETSTADDIRNDPERMTKVRDYMVLRKGNGFLEKDDAEVYDSFVQHMRWFNTNEVSTVGELRFINSLDDDKKAIAVDAYDTYDSLSSFATNDGIWGVAKGVGDYAGAALASPSSWLGLGVAKIATTVGSQGAKKVAMSQIMTAARETAISSAIKKGATQQAAELVGQNAVRQVATEAAKTRAVKEVVIATLTDTGASSFQDYLYQTTLINSGAQTDYSGVQTALAGLGGLIGGGIAYLPNLNKGSSGMDEVANRIVAGQERRAVDDLAKVKPELEKVTVKFQEAMTDWMKSVKDGEKLAGDSLDVRRKAVSLLLDPDPESATSIVGAMVRTNTALKRGDDAPTIAHQLVSFAKNLPEENLVELDEMFTKTTGISYREYVDIVATYARESGQGLKLFKDVGDAVGRLVSARSAADADIVTTKVADVVETVNPAKINYIMSVWRRALVSHPATTAVNVQGWGQAFGARALAETLHGGVIGTLGLATKMVAPNSQFADQALKKSKRLFAAQVFKIKNLLDPYATKEAFEALLAQAPTSIKKSLNEDAFGGVSMETAAKFGMNPENVVVKGVETLSNKAAALSGVKLQDIYTKSFSFLSKLDEMARKEYGESLEAIIDSGRLQDLSLDSWTKATDAALTDTFSVDYTKGKGPLSKIAASIEALSNIPLVGFLFPFGRFLNNNMAFVMQYSPVAALPILMRATRKGFFATQGANSIFQDQNMEAMSKMLVGSMALATVGLHQRNKSEKGLAWNQEEDGSGSVYTVENMAPGSVYLLAGRILDLAWRGEAVSDDLLRSLGDQLGTSRITRDLSSSNSLDETIKYFLSAFDEEADSRDFISFLNEMAANTIAEIGSGFTRPLDPINAVVGVTRDTDTRVDRRLVKTEERGQLKSFLRYLDNIFVPMIGEENKAGRTTIGPAQQDATKLGEVREVNPIARIFGSRLVEPRNAIDTMLNKVNIAPWTTQERSEIPEWDSLINEKITPLLNAEAERIMKTDTWKNGNQRTREAITRTTLKKVRAQVADWLGSEGEDNGALLKARRDLLRLPKSYRQQAKASLKIDTIDQELSWIDIQRIDYWVRDMRDYHDAATTR